MNKNQNFGFLFVNLVLFLAGLLIFLNGLFPINFNEKYMNISVDRPTSIGLHKISPPTKQSQRIVIMIIDALRHDFIRESNMPFAFNNACIKLKMEAAIPTVTLPRIKSLMGGSLSSFSDIVLNLGSPDQMDDSLLHRIRKNGDVAIFAGDNLWVNLFPNIFKRQKANTDSLFVKDFYEGDRNVTNTILRELKNTDWNIFIAHYLGLDHIGHVKGSTSRRIVLKLKEMDEVIEKIQIFGNMTNGILLVTGDHGMRDNGGHGGGTMEEVLVPLLVFRNNCVFKSKPKLYVKEFKQIDLTATLAVLMSSEIPKQSVGCIIPDLIDHMALEDQLYAYHYNAMHLLKIAHNRFGHTINKSDSYAWLTSANEMHADFLKYKRTENITSSYSFEKSKQDYIRASMELSNTLVDSTAEFKYELITIGIILSTLVTINITMSAFLSASIEPCLPNVKQCLLNVGLATCILFIGKFVDYIEASATSCCVLVVPTSISIFIFANLLKRLLSISPAVRHILPLPRAVLACFLFQSLSLASTSFIEEEHQTWYYFGSTLIIALCIEAFMTNMSQRRIIVTELKAHILLQVWYLRWSILLLVLIALLKKLNQTGDKWKQLQDFGDILNEEANKVWLSAFFALGLIMLVFCIHPITTTLQFVISTFALLLIYCYRGVTNAVVFPVYKSSISSYTLTCFWVCLALIALNRLYSMRFMLYDVKYGKQQPSQYLTIIGILKTNLTCSLLISALLHKPHNVLLLFSLILILQESYRLCDRLTPKKYWKYSEVKSLTYKAAITFVISKMFYFYQGNSNSLATIDLNPGYIGQNTYNPLFAAIFVTFNTYNAQFNAYLYLLMHMYENNQYNMLRASKGKPLDDSKSLETTTRDGLQIVTSFFTVATMVPTTIYLFLLIFFRHHLFIYSVFAPKALYECFNSIVIFLNYSLTYICLKIAS